MTRSPTLFSLFALFARVTLIGAVVLAHETGRGDAADSGTSAPVASSPKAALGVAGGTREPARRELRLRVLERRACKPQAPLELHFEVRPVPGAAHLLDVQLEIEPRIDLTDVHWSLELPEGVTAHGVPQGAADGRANVPTHKHLVLELTGRHQGAPAPSELALVVEGVLPNSAGTEVVTRSSSVRLPGAEDVEPTLRHFTDADTGVQTRVAVLPVVHRSGR